MKFVMIRKTPLFFQLAVLTNLFAFSSTHAQTSAQGEDGKAVKIKKLFSMENRVSILIDAPAARIWGLLTDAPGFPKWNSTVKSIEGQIAEGEKIKLVASIAPDRTFSLKIKDVIANQSMNWKDGAAPMFKGVRTFTLEEEQGKIRFTMVEKMGGVMFPMIYGSLPDFRQPFEDYAADLKKAAEKGKAVSH